MRRLAEVCRREGVSRAEEVRRAVADYLDARCLRAREDAFGLWRDRRIDGLEYERRRRSEWPEAELGDFTPGEDSSTSGGGGASGPRVRPARREVL